MGIVMASTRQKWSTQPCINPKYKECRFTLKGTIGTKVNDLTKYYNLHVVCMYWSIKYQNYIFNVISWVEMFFSSSKQIWTSSFPILTFQKNLQYAFQLFLKFERTLSFGLRILKTLIDPWVLFWAQFLIFQDS
jgi:hypothetical protein